MNAAGRTLASELGLELIDNEALAAAHSNSLAANGPLAAGNNSFDVRKHRLVTHMQLANIYLNLLWQMSALYHPGSVLDGGKVDPAAPWMLPKGTAFNYTGLENDLARLAEVQVKTKSLSM